MFQDPYASLNPQMTVQRILAEPLTARGGMSHAERRRRVSESGASEAAGQPAGREGRGQ